MQKSAHNQLASARATSHDDSEPSRSRDDNRKGEEDIESQEYEEHDEDEEHGIVPEGGHRRPQQQHYVRHPTWLLGTLLMGLGEIGNFAAFAFAPASLVAPLGAWSVVLTSILAYVFLHEHISRTGMLGIVLCVVGALLIGTTGPDIGATEVNLSPSAVMGLLKRPPFVVFIVGVCTITFVLMVLAHRTTLGHRYIFVYVGVSSLLGAVTVVCAKALSTFLKLTFLGRFQLYSWLPVVLVLVLGAAIALQLKYLNMAMARFGNAVVVPIYYVLFTACAMTSGVIMYREFETIKPGNIPFFVGVIATMTGVFLIHRGDRARSRDTAAADSLDNGTRAVRKGYERVPIPPSKTVQDPVTTKF